MNKKGFTLIELVIVVAIIGLLVMIAIPAYVGQQKRAARTEAYTNLENLRLLQEQFFAENGRYTTDLGVNGNNTVQRNLNIAAIRTTANNSLPGFRPSPDASFVYWIDEGNRLPVPPGVPFDPAAVVAVVAPAQCFVAMARGIVGTRVDGDLFAIDCNNNRNF